MSARPDPASPGPPSESKGVAVTNWFLIKATGFMEKRASRRGFLIGSALAGSAVAVSGIDFVTRPGSAYAQAAGCPPGSFCADGYTEFCCAITAGGLNTCPPGSFAGGWWRADNSSFCGGGTRYYIDCMQDCCGPPLGYQNFCAGCTECRCVYGCGTRRVYCNYFRYGQCHQEIVASGPIACRVVTCVPPYTIAEFACSPAAAVDNSTAEHAGHCLPAAPPPPPPPPLPPPIAAALPSTGAAVVADTGLVSIFVRGVDGHVWYRDFNGSWSGWNDLGGFISSGIAAVASGTTTYVLAQGGGNAIWGNRRSGANWSGWHSLGGVVRSDPVAAVGPDGILVMARGGDDGLWSNRFDGFSWRGWGSPGGKIDSEAAASRDTGSIVHVLARGTDSRIYANRYGSGGWSGWGGTGGTASSDLAVVSDASGTYGFTRGGDNAVYANRTIGSTWLGWSRLGGVATSDPVAVADTAGVHVFVRGTDNAIWHNLLTPTGWTGFISLGGFVTTDPVAVATPSATYLFVRGDIGLWYGTFVGGVWSGWMSLAGALAPIRANVP